LEAQSKFHRARAILLLLVVLGNIASTAGMFSAAGAQLLPPSFFAS
jgi:hypothetical protein